MDDSTPTNADPLELALREVADATRLLEALIKSSESFDYIQAKATLKELRAKVRALGRCQAQLSSQRPPDDLRRIIPFPPSARFP